MTTLRISRGRRPTLGLLRRALFLGLAVYSAASLGGAVQFQVGDVFAGAGGGNVRHFSPTGTLIETLVDGVNNYQTGMCFDAAGNLYVTNLTGASGVSKFDVTGALVAANFISFSGTAESCVVDAAGNIFVGGPGSNIQKFSSAGAPLTTYAGTASSDWIDLAADQCTMFYDGEGPISKWNVCTNTSLGSFTSSSPNYAIRILPNGNVIAASGAVCHLYDPSGNILASYDDPSGNVFFALNRDPDGTHFWSADINNSIVFKFDFAQLSPAVLTFPGQQSAGFAVAGLAVYGELTAAQPTPTPGGPTPTPTVSAVVPTLSPPMFAFLAVALALIAFAVLSRKA